MDLQSTEDEDITPPTSVPTTKAEQSLQSTLTSPPHSNNWPIEETGTGLTSTEESAHEALNVDSTGPSTEESTLQLQPTPLENIPSSITTIESSTLSLQEELPGLVSNISTMESSLSGTEQTHAKLTPSPQCVSDVEISSSGTQPEPPLRYNLKRKLPQTFVESDYDNNNQLPEGESSSETTFPSIILLPVVPRPQSDSSTISTSENASEPIKGIKNPSSLSQIASTSQSIATATQTSSIILVSPPEPVRPTTSLALENTSQQELEMKTTSPLLESTSQTESLTSQLDIETSVTPEIVSQSIFKVPLPPRPLSFRLSQIPLPPMPQCSYAQCSRANTPPQLRAVPRIVLRDCLLEPSLRGLLHSVKFKPRLSVFRPQLPHFQPPLPSYEPPEYDEEERKIPNSPPPLSFPVLLPSQSNQQVHSPILIDAEDDHNETNCISSEEDLVDHRLNTANDVTTETDSSPSEVTVYDNSSQTDLSVAVSHNSKTPTVYSVSSQTDVLLYRFPSHKAEVPTVPLVTTIQPNPIAQQYENISVEASTSASAQPQLITQPIYEDISTASSPHLSDQPESPKSVVDTENAFVFNTSDSQESETFDQTDSETDNPYLRFAKELYLNIEYPHDSHRVPNRSGHSTPPGPLNTIDELQSREYISNNLLIIHNRISDVCNPPDQSNDQTSSGGTSRRRRRSNFDGSPTHIGSPPKLIKLASRVSKNANQPRLSEAPSRQAGEAFASTSHYSQAESSLHEQELAPAPDLSIILPLFEPERLPIMSDLLSQHSLALTADNGHQSSQHRNNEKTLPALLALFPFLESTPKTADSNVGEQSRSTEQSTLTPELIQRFLDSQPSETPSGDQPKAQPMSVNRFLQSLPESLPPPPSAPELFYNDEHSMRSLQNRDRIGSRDENVNSDTILNREKINYSSDSQFEFHNPFTMRQTEEIQLPRIFYTYALFVKYIAMLVLILCIFGSLGMLMLSVFHELLIFFYDWEA